MLKKGQNPKSRGAFFFFFEGEQKRNLEVGNEVKVLFIVELQETFFHLFFFLLIRDYIADVRMGTTTTCHSENQWTERRGGVIFCGYTDIYTSDEISILKSNPLNCIYLCHHNLFTV